MSRQQILALLTDAETVPQLMVRPLVLPLDVTVKVLSLALLMDAETVVAIEDIMQDVVETATDRAQQLVQRTIVETVLVIEVMEHVLL